MYNEEMSELNIIYNIENKEEEIIRIFGYQFVENNKNICKMIIDNKIYEIKEYFIIKNYNNNKLEIKLKGISSITNMSYMFHRCRSLSSLPDISKWNTNKVTYMRYMFKGCSSLSSLIIILI